MTLTLIRLQIDTGALARWSAGRGFVTARAADEGRALHHLLAETFGPGALQPFRLMPMDRSRANLYAWSDSDADALRATGVATALPETVAVCDPDGLQAKPMPGFHANQRLGFDIRIRPVVRLHAALNGQNAKGEPVRFAAGAELDAFLARALRTAPDGDTTRRESVYLDWLGQRLPGAKLDRQASRLHANSRRVVLRGSSAVEGPDAVVHGTLTVTDPETFAAGLRRGIGRHCAFGYGMMMLRPPQAPVPRC